MKIVRLLVPVVATAIAVFRSHAVSLDDIQLWTGAGTNRAALVIEWNSPVSFNQTTVPAPAATKTMVWGYRFNGTATASQMFNAVTAADRRLYAVEDFFTGFGYYVAAIGYNLNGNGQYGLSDGSITYPATAFTNGVLLNPDFSFNLDGAAPINPGDLYWGGSSGPNWVTWTNSGFGGFTNSPNRGTNQYWDTNSYTHGQWNYAMAGLDGTTLTNGAWVGFTVAGAGYPNDTNDLADLAIFNTDEQAPPSPDPTYAAFVANTNDFGIQVVSSTNILSTSPYNDPASVLGRPTLKFIDHFGDHGVHRTKLIEDPYWTAPDGSKVLTEITPGGQITVNMGRKVYDDPGNPYGIDLIIYGNSFFSASGYTGYINDATDLGTATLSTYGGHAVTVSVSQDGVSWYAYSNTPALFPQNAYRWDAPNHAWTDEQFNPTKPLNPAIAGQDFSTLTAADALAEFAGATGGTGCDLKQSGFPWIQYVRVQPAPGTYTVIDAIAAANPAPVGDALTITPANLAAGVSNLTFRRPDGTSNSQICVNFTALSDSALVSTIALTEFSSYAPAFGGISGAYQIKLASLTNTSPVNYTANLALRVGDGYSGDGGDLVAYQWAGTNWMPVASAYNSSTRQVTVAGITNLTAFTVSQVSRPQLATAPVNGGAGFAFAPMPGVLYTLQRSTNLTTWTNLTTILATNSQPVVLQDFAPPHDKAFYRLAAP